MRAGLYSVWGVLLLITSACAADISLERRASCKPITVVSGDGCDSLAKRCKITAAQFTKFNPGAKFCSTLVPGERACCSAGTLPSLAPKPNSDGSCHSYTVKSGDTCASLSAAYDLTTAKIKSFNKNTYAWSGCALLIGEVICLSTGTPPMPAPLTGAVCGPQKPGTKKPAAGVALASLNPCPLNACCDIWGQCGTTTEFCTDTSTGNPGTAKTGTNGCISNCGTAINSSTAPPNPFRKIGYFQGYNLDRECLNMDITQVQTADYTHLHYAFATLTTGFDVVIGDDNYTNFEFETFKSIKGSQKMLSIGGWTFSTDASTSAIFPNGVKAANRNTMATKIANFVNSNGLDGVDIDWEYPATTADGNNFLAFLKVLHGLLGSKKLSITAPASYYLLQTFPIKDIAATVSYIVFMTYDLNGSLGTGSDCPSGKCLRSGVNSTDVNNAYSMITKAGVPSNKVAGGVTSYGRSYKMAKAGCTGPTCQWVGSAAPGRCTQTSGQLADAEIKEIIATNKNIQQFHDGPSNTDILVYNDTQWVSYMTPQNKAGRITHLQKLNFGGFVDWALDLEDFQGPPGNASSDPNDWESEWDSFKATIDDGGDPLE